MTLPHLWWNFNHGGSEGTEKTINGFKMPAGILYPLPAGTIVMNQAVERAMELCLGRDHHTGWIHA